MQQYFGYLFFNFSANLGITGLQIVEHFYEIRFHFICLHGGILVLIDDVYPGAAKFPFRRISGKTGNG
jgi:hypothetical protein